MRGTIFLDTETTGLYPEAGHEVWDIALIARENTRVVHPDGPDTLESQDREYQWFVKPDLRRADPNALRINRFYERTAGVKWSNPEEVAAEIAQLFDGAHIVGMVPDFDIRHLSVFLRKHGQCPAHHYHLIDAETLAVGYMTGAQHEAMLWGNTTSRVLAGVSAVDAPSWRSDDLSAALGVGVPTEDRHTALGDARWARNIYDAVMGGQS